MKQIYKWCCVAAITLVLKTPYAQVNPQSGWEIGAGIGSTNYYGDVSPYRIHHLKDIYRVYRFLEFNRHYVNRPSFSLLAHKKLNNTVGILLQANALQFSMSDRYRRPNGNLKTNALNFDRALNFQTDLYDLGFAVTLNSNNGSVFRRDAKIYPSVHLGLGLSAFSVNGDLYDKNGAQYDYSILSDINDHRYETDLRELNTEDGKKYNNIAPYLNLGIAINFKISEHFRLALQSDIKYSGSDYLDDVSKTYRSDYATPAAAYAARPGTNTVNPVTLQRGDNNGVNDIYINNRLVILYSFNKKKNQPVFKAPVVYTLRRSTQYVDSLKIKGADTVPSKVAIQSFSPLAQQKIIDSVRDHDSLARSANTFDSGFHRTIVDTAFQKHLDNRLQTIQSDIREIKTVLRNQALIPRYQQLRFQEDSISKLSARLLSKPNATSSDRLQQRIYNLQKDSLRNEMRTIILMSQYPAEKIDTTLFQRNTDTAGFEILRPRFDSVTRIKTMHDSVAGDSQTLTQKAIDTLSAQEKIVLNEALQDSLPDQEEIDSLQSVVTASDAKLRTMQQQLKASRDSAAFYRRTLYTRDIDERDTIVEKKKWYERIIPRNTRQREKQTNTEEARLLRSRETYYSNQASRMDREISQLERANRLLQNDFDRLRRRRDNRIVSPPTVVLPAPANNNNRDEINRLREEIYQLRSQLQTADTSVKTNDTSVQNVLPPTPATDSTFAPANIDSSELASLRADLARMQSAIDSIRRTPVVESKPAEPVYDVKSFPVISVYFGMNAATLPSTQTDKLAPMAAVAKKNGAAIIALKGFADAVGNAKVNKAIATKRIEYVKNLLITGFGLAASQIITEEPEIPVVTGTKRANPLDRRVDLQFR